MDIISRIKAFMEARGITSSQLADTCNIPRPTMSQILNGRNKKISNDLIARIHTHFPYLSIMWLMFGEGEMFNNGNIKISEAENSDFAQDIGLQPSDNQIHFSDISFSENIHPKQSEKSVQYEPHHYPNDFSAKSNIPINEDTSGAQNLNTANNSKYATTEMTDFLGAFTNSIPSERDIPLSGQHGRTVSAIMVFYTDNSYEMFTPSSKN